MEGCTLSGPIWDIQHIVGFGLRSTLLCPDLSTNWAQAAFIPLYMFSGKQAIGSFRNVIKVIAVALARTSCDHPPPVYIDNPLPVTVDGDHLAMDPEARQDIPEGP